MAGPQPPPPPEGPAVQRWSRLGLVGPPALEAALSVFSPRSEDPGQSRRQLLSLVQGLRDEGCLPTVLRSRDVYGYTSCTCRVPPAASADPGASASASSPARSGPGPGPEHQKPAPKARDWLRPPAPGVRLGRQAMRAARPRGPRYPERSRLCQRAESQEPGGGGGRRRRRREAGGSNARLQLLRSKVIKVDDSSSEEEVRRKAQRILRVNLSPVIKIRPISHPS